MFLWLTCEKPVWKKHTPHSCLKSWKWSHLKKALSRVHFLPLAMVMTWFMVILCLPYSMDSTTSLPFLCLSGKPATMKHFKDTWFPVTFLLYKPPHSWQGSGGRKDRKIWRKEHNLPFCLGLEGKNVTPCQFYLIWKREKDSPFHCSNVPPRNLKKEEVSLSFLWNM